MLAGDIDMVVAVLWRRDAAFVSLMIVNMVVVGVECTRQSSHIEANVEGSRGKLWHR